MNTQPDSDSGSALSLSASAKHRKSAELWLFLVRSGMGVFTVLAAFDRLHNTHERNTILTLIWIVIGAYAAQIVWFTARKDRRISSPDEFSREWQRATFTFLALCCVALAILGSLTRAH
jgi:divalent metal cation (Fe/Co/Zn/Cd) transporter